MNNEGNMTITGATTITDNSATRVHCVEPHPLARVCACLMRRVARCGSRAAVRVTLILWEITPVRTNAV